MGHPRKTRSSARKSGPAKRSTKRSTDLTVSPAMAPPFPVGAKVEVKINADGFAGSWFEAIVTDHAIEAGRVVRYMVKYVSLVKEEDPEVQETDEVSVDDVRPEAPRSLKLTAGKENEDPEFEMHELVEAYHNEGWWYGVISGLKNQETGKYTVSFPISREIIDFPPSEIRPQLNFINGNWFPIRRKLQKGETYKVGDKVEAVAKIEKYGSSWFPAKVEKVIGDNNFLIKYENINYLPNGYITEILDFTALRPVLDRNPQTDKIELNSHVEFFHEGRWSIGVVTGVLSERNYMIKGENNDVLSEQVNEAFLRLRLQWDGKKWSRFNTSLKRGRPFGSCKEISASNKKKKNDISPSKKKMASERKLGSDSETNVLLSELKNAASVSAKSKNSICYSRIKRAVVKFPKSKLANEFNFSPSVNTKTGKRSSDESDTGAAISKVQMVQNQNSSSILKCSNGGHKQTPSSTPPNPNLNPNSNEMTSAEKTPTSSITHIVTSPLRKPSDKLVSTQSNPNANERTSLEQTPSSSISGDIILPFERRSPLWKPLEQLAIFQRIPQKPHFMTLQQCCKEERDGKALGLMVTYVNLAESIRNLSLDAELAVFEEKLNCLNSLEQDGFEVNPIRTHLNSMIEVKKTVSELGSKRLEKERELAQRYEDNTSVLENVDKIGAELADTRNEINKLIDREKRLRDKRERYLEKTIANGNRISSLKSEISRLNGVDEAAREVFLLALADPLWD